MITRKTNEVKIGRHLVPVNSRNHCVPILDAFQDPVIPDFSYIVMPLLRLFDNPEFGAMGEVIDFVTQLLEVGGIILLTIGPHMNILLMQGTDFMHAQLVAHG